MKCGFGVSKEKNERMCGMRKREAVFDQTLKGKNDTCVKRDISCYIVRRKFETEEGNFAQNSLKLRFSLETVRRPGLTSTHPSFQSTVAPPGLCWIHLAGGPCGGQQRQRVHRRIPVLYPHSSRSAQCLLHQVRLASRCLIF